MSEHPPAADLTGKVPGSSSSGQAPPHVLVDGRGARGEGAVQAPAQHLPSGEPRRGVDLTMNLFPDLPVRSPATPGSCGWVEQELEAGADPATGLLPQDEPPAEEVLTAEEEDVRAVDREILADLLRDADTPGFKQELLFGG